MESNLGGIQPQRIYGVRPARDTKDRKRERSSEKKFELTDREATPAPAPDRSETADHGAVSEREDGEAGGRLDLTA